MSSFRSREFWTPKPSPRAADLFTSIKGAQDFVEGRARAVSGLSALDRHTVQVVLNEALTPFVSVLAVGHAKIVPRDIVEQQGEAFGAQSGRHRTVQVRPLGAGKRDRSGRQPGRLRRPTPAGAARLSHLPGRGDRPDLPGVRAGQSRRELRAADVPEQDQRSPLPVRAAADLQRPLLRSEHASEAAQRRSGSPGDRARPGPRDDDPGDLPRPASAGAGHPARRHARLQPAAQDTGVRPGPRSCAAEGGGLPRGTRAARHRDLVGGPERADREGDAAGSSASSPPSASPPRCTTRPTGRPSRSASPRAASPCSCMPGTRTCRIRTTSCSSSFTPRACAT